MSLDNLLLQDDRVLENYLRDKTTLPLMPYYRHKDRLVIYRSDSINYVFCVSHIKSCFCPFTVKIGKYSNYRYLITSEYES